MAAGVTAPAEVDANPVEELCALCSKQALLAVWALPEAHEAHHLQMAVQIRSRHPVSLILDKRIRFGDEDRMTYPESFLISLRRDFDQMVTPRQHR
ncbi:hypothetical protein [Bradyrhizobium centrolobii]|uniref:hypothetical protein n=1 Tax=Bradyrhizobium centrolobii TaxID=1505087 RepID=UPI0010A95814|nr:hypothetical protein [Bradyrhizobium centrolobii]